MCILSYVPREAETDEESLWNGGTSNPDGHGWAIATGGRGGQIILGKSLDLAEAIETFAKARTTHDGPALFHSRWATHGGINLANCHPFLVGGSHRTVVAHNGILPRDSHPKKGDGRSDTRIFADDILSKRYRRLDRERVSNALTQYAGYGNKLVILTVDRRYRHNVYLVNERSGTWDSDTGIWWSNHDYLPSRWLGALASTGSARSSAGVLLGASEDVCLFCGYGKIGNAGYCVACETCQDCCEHMEECLCWVRGARDAVDRDNWHAEQMELDLG